MGSKKKKAPAPAPPPVQTPQVIQQANDPVYQQKLQQEYTNSLNAIQQQSNAAIEQTNKANQDAMAAVQAQLAAANQEKINYQQSLQKYLEQMQAMQDKYTGEINARDAATKTELQKRDEAIAKQQKLQATDMEAQTLMNNLMASASIAKNQFTSSTRRRKGLIA